MPDLSTFPITQRWPASHPDRPQRYAAPTPNGVKVSIMLEETGLAYEPHLIDISNNETKDPAFVSLNPNGRIPAIIDPAGSDGRPIAVWESGAIGWVNALVESYAAGDILGLSNYSNIQAWLGGGVARPAVQRGLHIPAWPA